VSGRAATRRLRAALGAGGLVATGAGLHTVIAGARSLPGRPRASAAVESDLRYYAGVYAAFGLVALRTAPRAEREPATVRALAGALLLGGLGRAAAWRASGRPHPVQVALLAVELGLPPLLVGAQARAGRSAERAERRS
jgi:Domain of unknown function (DUF4345)